MMSVNASESIGFGIVLSEQIADPRREGSFKPKSTVISLKARKVDRYRKRRIISAR